MNRLFARVREHAVADEWTPDLALFGLLLVLTAMFGKRFSKLGMPGGIIYVTEIALAVIVVLALRRVGFRGALASMRRSVPFVPLAIFWMAGAVAAARGLHTFGPHAVVQDVGLVEYSLVVPLVAVLVDTRRRAELLVRTLIVAGAGAAVTFSAGFFLFRSSGIGPDRIALSAVTIYLALAVLLPTAFLLFGVGWSHASIVVAAVCVVLIMLTVVRGALVALVVSAAALIVLSPRRGRGFALLGAAVGAAVVAAVALEALDLGWKPRLAGGAVPQVGASLVAADDGAPFSGGRVVARDAVRGRYSREVKRGAWVQVTVNGLNPGSRYDVGFFVKPASPTPSAGFVGDTSGTGWGTSRWAVGPQMRWYEVRKQLVATAPSERLVVWFEEGAPSFLVDRLQFHPDVGTGIPARTAATVNDAASRGAGGIPIIDDLRNALSSDPHNGSGANVRWRLSYWRYILEHTLHEPLLGVGFGKPASFRWRGVLYDARRGATDDPNDITPPHNSFLNVFYRMGLIGLIALLVVMVLGPARGVSAARRRFTTYADRALLAGIVAVYCFAAIMAFFNVALENPYMALFFWTPLALLFAMPPLIRSPTEQDGSPHRT
ncbi:MAG: O-antigen ligase family protein [Gaiellaceae bacterium]